MSAHAILTEPPSAAPHDAPAPLASDHRALVDEVVAISADFVRLIHQQALAAPATAADTSVAFDRVVRCFRRTVLLARKLAEPLPAAIDPALQRAAHRDAARRRIIRAVEDAIQRPNMADDDDYDTDNERDALHAEFLDRLDRPEFDDDIANLPIAEIIADICRDLGLATPPGVHPWKRRTPDDIAQLCARAAQPPPPAAPPNPTPRFREK